MSAAEQNKKVVSSNKIGTSTQSETKATNRRPRW
jgi:hypothetical protein